MRNKHGVPHSRCAAHQRAYWRKSKAARRTASCKPKPPPRERPETPKRTTTTKKTRRGRKAKVQPPPTKLMLIDYERQTLQLLELAVVSQVPLADLKRGEPHPHTIGFYEHLGYRIAEIRPPQLAAATSEG